ncbi:hypothetical protein HH310_14775 [Actinoplanes sp. TBRC 11911]|uniref:hypothetical protein n=1 Tax=Actinoplanes sp. TBRC 11911 TaxID=2729386 RepID=UPI00145E3747|nr:hypothetical protein [Actinoplanes sp. TBRC 11911]NMO52451.1 hypothetical protein [Actinoplanes sp. TBRC 11911]
MSDSSAESDATDAEPTEEVFENRAARRAKGKKTPGRTEIFGKGQPPAGRGSVQSPRQYGNRRSG